MLIQSSYVVWKENPTELFFMPNLMYGWNLTARLGLLDPVCFPFRWHLESSSDNLSKQFCHQRICTSQSICLVTLLSPTWGLWIHQMEDKVLFWATAGGSWGCSDWVFPGGAVEPSWMPMSLLKLWGEVQIDDTPGLMHSFPPLPSGGNPALHVHWGSLPRAELAGFNLVEIVLVCEECQCAHSVYQTH